MSNCYPPEHLEKLGSIAEGNTELARRFFDWYGAVFAEGAQSEPEKALIALAVAQAIQCPSCMDAYSKGCLAKGADREQMTEAVHVAVAIRRGASPAHGVRMLEHVQQAGM